MHCLALFPERAKEQLTPQQHPDLDFQIPFLMKRIPGLLGEVASSQSGTGKVYDKLRTYGKKQEHAQRLIGIEQNDP